MKTIPKFLLAILVIINTCNSFAQSDNICGEPPNLRDETLKADIKGKAQLITKYLGGAELSGKIETTRTDIYSKYQDAATVRSDAFFEYQMCVGVFSNKHSTPEEKLEALKKIRREFQKPAIKRVSSIGHSSAILRSAFPSDDATQKKGCDEAFKDAISQLRETCLEKYEYSITSKSCPQISGSPRTYTMHIDADCMV